MMTTGYKPTKAHPHPLCHKTHPALGGIALIAAIEIFMTSNWLRVLLYLAVVGMASALIAQAIKARQASKDAADERFGSDAGHRPGGRELVVRPAWARISVAAEILLGVTSSLAIALPLTTASQRTSMAPALNSSAIIPSLLLLAFVTLLDQAHRHATHPATTAPDETPTAERES